MGETIWTYNIKRGEIVMGNTLKQKVVRGELVEVVESTSGFLGGIEYQLVVGGHIKEQSKDLIYILSDFDRYW